MLRLGTELVGAGVFSVHAGHRIGTVNNILVRNQDLGIGLLEVKPTDSEIIHYLIPNDIRTYSKHKIIINSQQELSQADELIRYQDFIQSANRVFNNKVLTQSGKNLGKVKDFTIDTAHYFIIKIHTTANFWQRLTHERLMIDRADIIDIKKNKIIVRDAISKAKSTVKMLSAIT